MSASRLCRQGQHDWCMNRSAEECHCDCHCHAVKSAILKAERQARHHTHDSTDCSGCREAVARELERFGRRWANLFKDEVWEDANNEAARIRRDGLGEGK